MPPRSNQTVRPGKFVPKGKKFGPYPGEDKEEKKKNEWMSSVPYSKNAHLCNLALEWHGGRMYYRATRDIKAREIFKLFDENENVSYEEPEKRKKPNKEKDSDSESEHSSWKSGSDSESENSDSESESESEDSAYKAGNKSRRTKANRRTVNVSKKFKQSSKQESSSKDPKRNKSKDDEKSGRYKEIDFLTCKFCDKEFVLKSSLQMHMQEEHSDEEIDELIVKKRKPLEKSSVGEKSQVKFLNCDKCERVFVMKNSLKLHMEEDHAEDDEENDEVVDEEPRNLLKCKFCVLSFNSKSSLKKHENYCSKFKCRFCKKPFSSLQSLHKHESNCDKKSFRKRKLGRFQEVIAMDSLKLPKDLELKECYVLLHRIEEIDPNEMFD